MKHLTNVFRRLRQTLNLSPIVGSDANNQLFERQQTEANEVLLKSNAVVSDLAIDAQDS